MLGGGVLGGGLGVVGGLGVKGGGFGVLGGGAGAAGVRQSSRHRRAGGEWSVSMCDLDKADCGDNLELPCGTQQLWLSHVRAATAHARDKTLGTRTWQTGVTQVDTPQLALRYQRVRYSPPLPPHAPKLNPPRAAAARPAAAPVKPAL